MHLQLPHAVRDFVAGLGHELVKREPEPASVSVVYVTAAKTFDGPAVYVTQSAGSNNIINNNNNNDNNNNNENNNFQTTSTHVHHTKHTEAATTSSSDYTPFSFPSVAPVTTSTRPTSTEQSSRTTQHSSTHKSSTTDASLPFSLPGAGLSTDSSSSSRATSLAADGSSSSSTATPSASQKSSSGGLSSGGKAGLAIGILLIIGILAGACVFFYRRRAKQMDDHQRLDDEKAANSNNNFPMMAAGGYRNDQGRSPSAAPRLSLRPVTQLFGMGANRRSAGNALDVMSGPTSAGGAVAYSPRGLRSPAPESAWEKNAHRDHANDPNNPFGNHAETVRAASPAHQFPAVPNSSARPDGLGLAAGAAGAGAVAAAAASRSANHDSPKDGSIVPKPLSIKSNKSAGPSSPTMTDSSEMPSVGGAAAAAGAAMPTGPNNVHRVQMDFQPSMEDELELRAGQLVRLLHEYDDGWALCVRMDRSQQGVVPRTCLSRHAVKPRPPPGAQGPRGPPGAGGPRSPPHGGPRGPPMGPPGGRNSPSPYGPPGGRNSPGPMGPPGGRNSPAPMGPPGGRGSPSPYGGPQQGRPMSPGLSPFPPSGYGNQQRGPPGPRGPGAPQQGGRSRSGSVPRSLSPGPYGAPGASRQPMMGGPDHRRRSKSMSQLAGQQQQGAPPSRRFSPPGMGGTSPLTQGGSMLPVPSRKPVPGMAM